MANIENVKREQISSDAELLISKLNKIKHINSNKLNLIDLNNSTDAIPQIPEKSRNKQFPGMNQNDI